MGYAEEIATLFKDRNNPKTLGPQIGTVKSVNPLKIELLDGQILLDSDDVLICKALKEGAKDKATLKINAYTVAATATDSRGDTINSISVPVKSDYDIELTYKQVLTVNDLILCLPAGNKFVIIDKVEVI